MNQLIALACGICAAGCFVQYAALAAGEFLVAIDSRRMELSWLRAGLGVVFTIAAVLCAVAAVMCVRELIRGNQ